jgi:hypothetical protein
VHLEAHGMMRRLEQLQMFDVPAVPSVKHPAVFSDELMPVLAHALVDSERVLDPFAGTGRIHELGYDSWGVEIEPEWAEMHPRTIVADALTLPFADGTFDAVCTSPTYANRFADHHDAKDGSVRHSYTHDLGRKLHPNNSGAMQWGEEYRVFHVTAWREVARVVRDRFVLNIKDHVRKKQTQPVTDWHIAMILGLGFELLEHHRIPVRSMRFGANGDARVEHESVVVFRKVAP